MGRKRQGDPVLLTLVERKTRFEKLFKIPCQSARAVHQTLQAFLKGLEDKASQVFQSIIADNGSEIATWAKSPKTSHPSSAIPMLLTNEAAVRTNTN